MSKCLGSPAAPESCSPPGLLGPHFGSIRAGRTRRLGGHVPAELGPGQQCFPAASSRAPRALPHREAIPEKELQSPWEWRGEALSKGPPGSRQCQTRPGVTPPGVCLPSDCWEGSWLLSAFWGDRAGLKQAGTMALPSAGWLPGRQRIYFRSRNQIAGQEGKPGAR